MTIEVWISFVAASMVLTMTPGPSIFLGVVHSINFGPTKTIYTALGDISANFIQMILVAVGLGVVIANSEIAFEFIKWAGIVMLCYLGVKMLFFSKPVTPNYSESLSNVSAWRLYMSGFGVAISNPKAIVFFTAFFPQFIDPTAPLFQQMAWLTVTMAVLDFSWVMIYALLARKFLGFLQSHPLIFNRSAGIVLIMAAVFLWFTSQ
ncbi:LysE family translocator [Curvivirga sp.]|uniref:LysE family translocator n=1 Tax=Curvivirga sp. TaxID=2856848 RepID=UPI003B58E6D7